MVVAVAAVAAAAAERERLSNLSAKGRRPLSFLQTWKRQKKTRDQSIEYFIAFFLFTFTEK